MNLAMMGLAAVGLLNIILGTLIIIISFRLSKMNGLVKDVESRISRLEILTSLQDSSTARTIKEEG
jgi:hypothetical protein